MMIGVSIMASVVISVITTKILAAHYFKIVDGYVKEMCDMTNKSNKNTLATVRKLEQRFLSKDCEKEKGGMTD